MGTELLWKMYSYLFNAITNSFDIKDKNLSDEYLKQAQLYAEELYMCGDNSNKVIDIDNYRKQK